MLSPERRARLECWANQVLPRALAYARSLVRDDSRADDLVQESLFRLLRRADGYDLEHDGVKLLFRAISNLCINEETRRRERQSPNDAADPVADERIPSPELAARGAELEAALRAAIATLPPMQRAAVELRALGMDREAIAEALEVSPANAAVLCHRGRAELWRLLGDKFELTRRG